MKQMAIITCGLHYSDKTKDYKICICRLCTKHASSRDKSKDWLDRIQDNVSEWSDMSNRRGRTSTIKIILRGFPLKLMSDDPADQPSWPPFL
jgi:hypothetical protein